MQILWTITLKLVILALGVGMGSAENLVRTQSWSYIADTVMGGVSQGSAVYVKEEVSIRLSGIVSTKNNGGFIQVRTNIGCLSPVKLCHNLVETEDRNYGSEALFGRRYFEAVTRD